MRASASKGSMPSTRVRGSRTFNTGIGMPAPENGSGTFNKAEDEKMKREHKLFKIKSK